MLLVVGTVCANTGDTEPSTSAITTAVKDNVSSTVLISDCNEILIASFLFKNT